MRTRRGGKYECIVFLGDSITYGNNGAGGRAASPYPTVCESLIARPSRTFVNAGVNSKYLRDILPSDALIYSPTTVCVAAGINDIYNLGGAAPSLATLQGYINALIVAFRAAGCAMVFGTVLHDNIELSAPLGAKEILRQDYNAWLRTLATTDIRIADPAEDTKLRDNNNTAYFGPDKVHPTAAGYSIIGAYYAAAMVGLAPEWSPTMLSKVGFWLQPPPAVDPTNGGRLLLSAGKVASASDAAGSPTALVQASGTRQPVVNTGSPVDGFCTIDWSFAADTHLESATGGLSGDVAHTLIALVKITAAAPYYDATYDSFLCYGNPAGENSHIGVQNAAGGSWWGGGGASHGTGIGGPGLGKPLNNDWHLLVKTSTGSEEVLLVDGVEVYRGDTGVIPAAGYLGAGRWINNATYACSSHRALDKIWIGQQCTDAEIRKIAYYLSRRYPTTYGPQLVCVGDSMSSGYLLTDPATESWPAVVAASRNYQLRQHAYPGWRTYLAGFPNMRDGGNNLPQLDKDAIVTASIITDWSGVNDINNAIDNTTLKGYKEANIALIRAKNPDAKLVGFTLLPSLAVIGSEETERVAHNTDMKGAWGASQYDQILDLEEIVELLNPADTTKYNPDGTHLNATGQGLVAAKFLAEVL